MPIYEYRCGKCRKKFSILVRSISEEVPVSCPRCGAENLTRLFSRFSFRSSASEEEMLEDLADPAKLGDIEDPKQLRKWAEKLGKRFGNELGEDMGDFEEALDEMEEEYHREKEASEGGDTDLD
jgi:putative FmdB family regulatory protein